MNKKIINLALLACFFNNIVYAAAAAAGIPVVPGAPVVQPAPVIQAAAGQQPIFIQMPGQAAGQQMPVVINPQQAPGAQPAQLNTLDQIQQGYASQPDNARKAVFINYILDNNANNFTVEQKIAQVKMLAQVIQYEISFRSGWLWNNPAEQPQIEWLQSQLQKVNVVLDQLQWQSRSFGAKTLITAATALSVYMSLILAAYVGQAQIHQYYSAQKLKTPAMFNNSYADLALMPIEQLMTLAKNATVGTYDLITSPQSEKVFNAIIDAGHAIAKSASETGVAIKQRLVGDINQVAAQAYNASIAVDKNGKPIARSVAPQAQQDQPVQFAQPVQQGHSAGNDKQTTTDSDGEKKDKKEEKIELGKDAGFWDFYLAKRAKQQKEEEMHSKEEEIVQKILDERQAKIKKERLAQEIHLKQTNKSWPNRFSDWLHHDIGFWSGGSYAEARRQEELARTAENLKRVKAGLPTVEQQQEIEKHSMMAQSIYPMIVSTPNIDIQTSLQKIAIDQGLNPKILLEQLQEVENNNNNNAILQKNAAAIDRIKESKRLAAADQRFRKN